MEENDRSVPYVFPYDTSVSQDFATCQSVQDSHVGIYVAFVFRAYSVNVKHTTLKSEIYLEVYGVDTQHAATGSLRFWRFEEGDIVDGHIYIVRGLKVAMGQAWDESQQKYVARADLPRKVECTRRTAIEDVTEVDAIATLFS